MTQYPIIPLPSQEYLNERLLFDASTGKCYWKAKSNLHDDPKVRTWNTRYAGKEAGWMTPRGVRSIAIDEVKYLLHRVVWKMLTGSDPAHEIDHIDVDPNNADVSNLREATHQENCCNRLVQSNNTSGYKGVTRHVSKDGPTDRWVAQIMLHGKHIHIGIFDTKEAAAAAYSAKALDLHGEFARIN